MELTIHSETYHRPGVGDIVALKPCGPIDQKSVQVFEAAVLEFYRKGICRLILDLSETKYLNSTGLGLLINIAHRVNVVGGGVRLISVAEKFKVLFDMLGLETCLPILSGFETALESFGESTGETRKITKLAEVPEEMGRTPAQSDTEAHEESPERSDSTGHTASYLETEDSSREGEYAEVEDEQEEEGEMQPGITFGEGFFIDQSAIGGEEEEEEEEEQGEEAQIGHSYERNQQELFREETQEENREEEQEGGEPQEEREDDQEQEDDQEEQLLELPRRFTNPIFYEDEEQIKSEKGSGSLPQLSVEEASPKRMLKIKEHDEEEPQKAPSQIETEERIPARSEQEAVPLAETKMPEPVITSRRIREEMKEKMGEKQERQEYPDIPSGRYPQERSTEVPSKKEVVSQIVTRKTTVRYYNQMARLRTYPVSISFSGKAIAKNEQAPEKNIRNPFLIVVPWFPGCQVVPEKVAVDISYGETNVEFWVTPSTKGGYQKKIPGWIEIYYQGKSPIKLKSPFKIVKPGWTFFTGFCTFLSGAIGFIFHQFQAEVFRHLPRFHEWVMNYTGGWKIFGVYCGAFFLLITIFRFLRYHEKDANPIEQNYSVNMS